MIIIIPKIRKIFNVRQQERPQSWRERTKKKKQKKKKKSEREKKGKKLTQDKEKENLVAELRAMICCRKSVILVSGGKKDCKQFQKTNGVSVKK